MQGLLEQGLISMSHLLPLKYWLQKHKYWLLKLSNLHVPCDEQLTKQPIIFWLPEASKPNTNVLFVIKGLVSSKKKFMKIRFKLDKCLR